MNYWILNVRTDANACDCARGCTDTVRESALKVDSGSKVVCRTGESKLRQRRAGPTLYQLNYIRVPVSQQFCRLTGQRTVKLSTPIGVDRFPVLERYGGLIIVMLSSLGLLRFFLIKYTPVLPQWHVKDPGHSAKSAGGRLHLNTHTLLTHRSRSGLTMPLCRGNLSGDELTCNS